MMKELDVATLNDRLLAGHRLVVTLANSKIVGCEIEFFDEAVPVSLFNTYLANGMIEVPKDGRGYKLSTAGKNRLGGRPGRRN
jgi:hypothetical protein